jgi:SAM-dependent methyltransferase
MTQESEFYDDPDVRTNYFLHRKRPDNPNDVLERPLFLELAGDLTNLDIIDLGCGDAAFGKEALLKGARSYEGIEVSQAMVDIARQMLFNTSGIVRHESIETWQAKSEKVDLVSSRLALHYLENLKPVLQEIYQALRPSGRAIVSVEHPVITSSFVSLAAGCRTTWLVDNYFKSGARVHMWLGKEVTKYHRTLEDYFNLFTNVGFEISCIREAHPQKVNFLSEKEYERRLRIPLFLFIAARKPQ